MLQTYQPNNKKMKKDHGFRARKQAGTNVVNNRRKKGRKNLTK